MEKVHNLNIIRRRRIELNRGKRIERRCARQGQMASKSSQEEPEASRTQMSDSIIYLLQIKGSSSGSRKRSPRASPNQVKCQHKWNFPPQTSGRNTKRTRPLWSLRWSSRWTLFLLLPLPLFLLLPAVVVNNACAWPAQKANVAWTFGGFTFATIDTLRCP